MTQSAWPEGSGGVSEEQFRYLMRSASASRVVSGLTVVASSSDLQLTLASGFAVVQGFAYLNDASLALSVDSNSTGSARRAYMVLELDPTSSPRVQAKIVNGPSGGGAPTFTQTDTGVYQLPVAWVSVASGATTLSGVTVNTVSQDPLFVGTTGQASGSIVKPDKNATLASLTAVFGETGRIFAYGSVGIWVSGDNNAGTLAVISADDSSSRRWHNHAHGSMWQTPWHGHVFNGRPGDTLTVTLRVSVDSAGHNIEVWDSNFKAFGF